jgi:predicted nuclease of restriction endonuclease-like (RecB) superfamily
MGAARNRPSSTVGLVARTAVWYAGGMGDLIEPTGEGGQAITGYDGLVSGMVELLAAARSASARAVNTVMTATYWEVGRRVVEHEQGGEERAGYGEELLRRLADDLTGRFGRGFSVANLERMRLFYLTYRDARIPATPSRELGEGGKPVTLSRELAQVADDTAGLPRFPLTWSHYTKLITLENPEARRFYETEALRGGWTVRQLNRQIGTQFYERTALSRDKAAMLRKGEEAAPADEVTPEEAIKDPYLLEFLDLKDEYAESDLEDALIRRLEAFLLELGPEFAFVGRQRRLRVGDAWYRIDLLFFHRRLRCLVIIDLKLGELTHADAGQMHLYCNYAREHWTLDDENPPVGLILCADKDAAVAHYALDGLPNKVLAAEYRTALPDEQTLAAEIDRARRALGGRG